MTVRNLWAEGSHLWFFIYFKFLSCVIWLEAWVEQSKFDHSSSSVSPRSHSPAPLSDDSLPPGVCVASDSVSSTIHRQGTPPLLLDELKDMLLEPHPSPQPPGPGEMFFITEGKLTPNTEAVDEDTDNSTTSSHKGKYSLIRFTQPSQLVEERSKWVGEVREELSST